MQNYRAGNKVHVLDSEEFKYLLPPNAVKITQAQADALLIKTSAEIEAEKNTRVESELGTDVVRILMETLIPLIDPSLNVGTVINQAKASRKAEL